MKTNNVNDEQCLIAVQYTHCHRQSCMRFPTLDPRLTCIRSAVSFHSSAIITVYHFNVDATDAKDAETVIDASVNCASRCNQQYTTMSTS